MIEFKTLFRILSGQIEQNYEKPQSGLIPVAPEYKAKSRSANDAVVTFGH